MSDADIERAINEAKEYESTDGIRRERLDVLNEAANVAAKASMYIRENKKTMVKAARKNLSYDLSALEKMIRNKKIDKMTDSDTVNIKEQTNLVKSQLPEDNSSIS